MAYVSIIVPVYNNARSLSDLLGRLDAVTQKHSGDSFEFIFIEDGSQDNSFDELFDLARSDARVRIVKLSRNFGSNAALLAGLEQVRGEVVAAIAADLQDPPELVNEMLDLWRQGRKVVLAARNTRDDPTLNMVLADLFYWLFRRLAIATMPRHGFDFFLIDRQVCDLINTLQERKAYLMGLILWVGFDPAIIYCHRQRRQAHYGRSMWTFRRRLKYAFDALATFVDFPIWIASCLGLMVSCFELVYALTVIGQHLVGGGAIDGWTALLVVLVVVSGGQLMLMGIFCEYLRRHLYVTRMHPLFIIERIVQNISAQAVSDKNEVARS